MKFTLSWLRDHLETSAPLDEILTALTDLGHEVEGVENPEAALGALGDGVWVGNLWYLNWSDRSVGRFTGMTRFATFWVEGGEIVAPVDVMRFDDSLYSWFGGALEDLTRAPELQLSTDTYFNRSTDSLRLPGALLSGLRFTL